MPTPASAATALTGASGPWTAKTTRAASSTARSLRRASAWRPRRLRANCLAADPLPIPDGLDPGEAVALLADGRTALALVRAAAITPTDRVLVLAAAGG